MRTYQLIAGADGMRAYAWENGVKAVKIIDARVFFSEGNYFD